MKSAANLTRCLQRNLIVPVLLMLCLPSHVLSAPYDCPGTTTKERKEYVCAMSSKVGPDLWNQWGKIQSKGNEPYKTFQSRRRQCTATCESGKQICSDKCQQKCKNGQCLTSCAQSCESRNNKCQAPCQSRSFGTSMRRLIKQGRPFARLLAKNCIKSASASACEQAEAKPFCEKLEPAIVNYRSAIRRATTLLGPAVDASHEMLYAANLALNQRFAQLSAELTTKKFKCSKKDAINQNGANDPNNACIMPQYKFNIPLAALTAYGNSDDLPLLQSRVAASVPDLDSLSPALDIVGVTKKYCWDDSLCGDDSKLVQNYGPGQILNYFGLAAGKASGWGAGTVVEIGGQEFRIKCIDQGAPSGGSTACRAGWGTPASFDIVIVEESDRPAQNYSAGSCVTFVR